MLSGKPLPAEILKDKAKSRESNQKRTYSTLTSHIQQEDQKRRSVVQKGI